MLVVMWAAAALAGIIHVLFFCMESLWWTKPAVYRRFRSTAEQAQTTKSLALNQGFYNLFLAAGALGGLALIASGRTSLGLTLVTWNCASMLAARRRARRLLAPDDAWRRHPGPGAPDLPDRRALSPPELTR